MPVSVSCPNENTCFVASLQVGTGSLPGQPTSFGVTGVAVAVTNDAPDNATESATFTHLTLPSSLALFDSALPYSRYVGISCPTVTTCFLGGGGDHGAFLESTHDGGGTWARTAALPGMLNGYLSCASDHSCAVATRQAVGGGFANAVDVTVDGGQSWTRFPIGAGDASADHGSLACAGISRCVATGMGLASGVVVTSRGGQWRSVKLPTGSKPLAAVDCHNSLRCVAVGPGDEFTSSDGGDRWAPVTGVLGDLRSVRAIACGGTSTCVLTGQYASSLWQGPVSRLEVSSDGGKSWQKVRSSTTSTYGAVACATGSICLAGGYARHPSGTDATIYRSVDDIRRWTPVALPLAGFVNSEVDDIACPRPHICFAVVSAYWPHQIGEVNVIIKSIDAGAHWRALTHGANQPYEYQHIYCDDHVNCLLTGTSLNYAGRDCDPFDCVLAHALHMTREGASFEALNLPPGMGESDACSFVGPLAVVDGPTWRLLEGCDFYGTPDMAGSPGTPAVITSIDGGQSWHNSSPMPAHVYEIAFTKSATHYVVVGQSPRHGPSILTTNFVARSPSP
jgi:photosystem II stability/assembly factor-like uncharacterized protein